jgi:surface antigen
MGYTGPDWRGDGGDVASNINRLLGRPDSHTPSVGAIVSSPGHVAVVEELRTGSGGRLEFRVSEMNMGGNGWHVARSDEFRDTKWHALDPAKQTFAAFP